MAKFLLIHGAWHGAWCWRHLTPLLHSAGHEVLAPDLPGLGADTTPLAGLSMAHWVARLRTTLTTTPGPAILVGHSRGGAVASLLAEAVPELVSGIIFVSGFLLAPGESVLAAAQTDIILPTTLVPGTRSYMLEPDAIIPHFYADCSAADIAYALPRLRPEPLFGLTTPMTLTPERFGQIPLHYVECTQDRTVSPAAQRRMQSNWPLHSTTTLPTGHCPFLATPTLLADALLRISGALG